MPARYQREIEEILGQTGNPAQRQAAPHIPTSGGGSRRWVSRMAQAIGFRHWRVSPGRLMIASIGILLSAWLLNTFNAPAAGPVAWGGLALFIAAYALFFILPPSKPRTELRWRGQPVSYDRPSWRDRLHRWFKT